MSEKCWECGEFKPEDKMQGEYDGMWVCKDCWGQAPADEAPCPESARDEVIKAARELEGPFERGEDIDAGRLMDALLCLEIAENQQKSKPAVEIEIKVRQMLRLLGEALPLAEADDKERFPDDTGWNTLSKEMRGVLAESEAIKEAAKRGQAIGNT